MLNTPPLPVRIAHPSRSDLKFFTTTTFASLSPKTVFEVIGSGLLRDYVAQTPEAKVWQLESGLGDLGKSGAIGF